MICSSHFGDGCREETSLMKAKMGFNTEFRHKADAVPVAIIKAPSASTRAEPHAGNFIPTPTTPVVYDYEESKSETYKSKTKSKKTTKNLKKEKKNAKKLKGKAKSNVNVRPTLQQTAKTALKRKEQSLVGANMETTTVTEETKKSGCSRPKRMHRGRQCVVGGCGNFDINGFIIYCLPEHSALVQRRWLKFVQSTRASRGDSRLKDGKKVFVCSGHFKAEDYEQTQIEMYRRGFRTVPPRLKENAIPTVQEARLPFQRDLLHQVATQATTSSLPSAPTTTLATAQEFLKESEKHQAQPQVGQYVQFQGMNQFPQQLGSVAPPESNPAQKGSTPGIPIPVSFDQQGLPLQIPQSAGMMSAQPLHPQQQQAGANIGVATRVPRPAQLAGQPPTQVQPPTQQIILTGSLGYHDQNTRPGVSVLTPSYNIMPAQTLMCLGVAPGVIPNDLSPKINNFLSIGEYIQPSTDPCTIAEDDTGTVAASTGISENVSKSGLPHDYPAADVIVLKFKPACLPEREISNTTACFDYNPLSDDVEPVSETVPSSQITASSTAGHLSSTNRKTIVIGRRNDGKSSKHLKEVNVSPSEDQDKLVTAGQLSSTPRKTIVIGKRNDGKSSKHLKEVYALPSSDHDYCITSDMIKEGRTKGSKRKSPLTPRSELADIPTDQQGQTTKQCKRGKRVCKRTTQVVKKSDPGSETGGVTKGKDGADEEDSGCNEIEIEEKQEEEEEEEKEEEEEEEEEEDEWLESSEPESEEGYDSNDPDYLPSNDVEEEKEYNPRRYHVEKYMILAKRYRCSICVESFLSILDFDKHMDSNHDVQGEVFRSELLQLLEEKKTPEVLERYKEELQKRGLNPEAVGRRRPPSIQFQRRTRMQTRASKRRTEQEGIVGKTNDEGDRDHSHLSGDVQPENIHPAEVSVEKRTAGVKPTEESPSRNEKQGSNVEGTIGTEGTIGVEEKDAGSIPVSHNLTEMTGDDIVNALASMLGGKEDLSDELTKDHCEAGSVDIEGKVEPDDSERREESPDRTLVDQEDDAKQSTDVGMHDERKSSETGNGSKNVANAESESKDELKSFSLDQDVDIVCWMGGWSDIFLECEICKAHIYLYRIYRHLSTHREVMHCMNCNFWHVSESLFKAHLQSCQEKESGVCELCGESYKDVLLHMRLEHTYTYGKKKAKTKASKKKTAASGHTARKGILNRYVNLARRYRCTICRELFSSIHGFDKHMDSNHDVQGEAFRSGLLEILEEKTLQAVQKRQKELQTIRRKEETKLRKLQGLEKLGNLSECLQPSRVNDGSTGVQTRVSNRRTEQEGVMVKRKDEGEGDCSHLSGEGKPENIHPADEETPGTVQGDDGQGKDDGGLQNGYHGDYESSLSKKCSFEATALENPGELCVLEGEREKRSISCEGMTVEESLSCDTMMALNNVMEDQTALSFSEKNITGIIPAIATSPAEENSSRFEKEGSCDKGTISAEGTDAANIPVSNESAEEDISDVLTSMLGGEKTLLSALTDEQFGTTCEAGLLNIGELEAGDSESREGSPDRTLVDQEENAEQSIDGGIHDEQNGVETDSENKNVATTDLGIIDEQETLASSNESRNVANACTETVLMDEPIGFSPDQDIDIIYWMEGWSDILMECDVCKTYVIFTQMGRHLNTHSKVMHCKYCHRLYENEDLLKDHVAYCSSKKVKERYVCEYCGKSYTSITKHIRCMHSQVGTSFPCKLCDRSFSSSSKLRRHMESHSLVKSYSCTVCGRGFSQKNNLQGHMRQHTKEKPFKCSMCDKAFTHKVSLKNHIWRHHGIDMWVLNPSSSTGRPKKAGKKRKEGHTESTPKKRQRRKVK